MRLAVPLTSIRLQRRSCSTTLCSIKQRSASVHSASIVEHAAKRASAHVAGHAHCFRPLIQALNCFDGRLMRLVNPIFGILKRLSVALSVLLVSVVTVGVAYGDLSGRQKHIAAIYSSCMTRASSRAAFEACGRHNDAFFASIPQGKIWTISFIQGLLVAVAAWVVVLALYMLARWVVAGRRPGQPRTRVGPP
jgi:hypothetical protein